MQQTNMENDYSLFYSLNVNTIKIEVIQKRIFLQGKIVKSGFA